ncbi:hypothetical protein MMC30_001554 [Trapelia coarctata]|nr:hypothetical protein [Trapelia coarctata]
MEQHNKRIKDLQSSLNSFRSDIDEHQARTTKQHILQWITTEYQWEWQNGLLNDDGTAVVPATLWCHGPPGAGKSTLVYAIVECLRKFYGKDALIVYTYCSYEKQEAQSTRSILACMVRMAVSEYEPLPEYVLEAWKRQDSGSGSLALSSLRDLLCKLLAGRRKSFILVDALDEITDSESKSSESPLEPDRVLNEMTTILKEVNKLKVDHGRISCRALVTSREKCPDRFPRAEVAEMPIEAAEADVKIIVEAAIDGGFFRALAERIQRDAKVRADIVDHF